MQNSDRHVANKQSLYRALQEIAEAAASELPARLASVSTADAQWRMSHPLNEMTGRDQALETVWLPLKRALPDLERRDLILIGGDYQGRDYVAAVGHYCGTFRHDWLSIPATGRPVFLRYGEVYEVKDGKIVQATCLWDILDLIRQAGFWPIAPSLGTEGHWAGPITGDGIVLTATDPGQSAASIAQTLAMHKTLGDYNDLDGRGRQGLLDMPQKEYWHPKMMWYGPSGIGTTRGLQGFVDYHQLPFRLAFPNRKGGGQWTEKDVAASAKKGGHYIRVGDGPYSVTGGWPSVMAYHSGGSFLDVGATDRLVTMRVMDFYLHHEGLIRENWVPLDILDLLTQMGVDVIDRMQSHFNRGRM
ncbi:ester cyclase [Shinella yambaruensis]|uniref:nuclear transport factor 2 family protein n=1 Tax=Shinella yambaruensis TaxID=415996 RepID=UPI003D7A8420